MKTEPAIGDGPATGVYRELLELLRCPRCGKALALQSDRSEAGRVREGELSCPCGESYPIVNSIPRFVSSENYADNFRFEWERWAKLRSDRYNGTTILRDTILRRTGWGPDHLRGKSVLECGCGAGNDTEVLLGLGAKVLSFDLSGSVDVAWANNLDHPNLLVVQANINHIPAAREAFDVVYCHRVIQHTPNPKRAFVSMSSHVRPDGEMFLHSYSTRLRSLLHAKYVLRPMTRRMDYRRVFGMLEATGPAMYRWLRWCRKPGLKWLRRLIPFENHERDLEAHGTTLTDEEKYEYSFSVAFDALTPAYDKPQSAATVRRWFEDAGFQNIQVRRKKPVAVVGRQKRPAGDKH